MFEQSGMDRIRVQTQEADIPRRSVRLDHLQISGTSSGAANTFYTVRDGITLEVKRLSVVNTSGTAAWITLHSVVSGGSIATGNAELVQYDIAANTAVDLTDLIGGFYESGNTLEVWAETTNVLVVHGWAEEIL